MGSLLAVALVCTRARRDSVPKVASKKETDPSSVFTMATVSSPRDTSTEVERLERRRPGPGGGGFISQAQDALQSSVAEQPGVQTGASGWQVGAATQAQEVLQSSVAPQPGVHTGAEALQTGATSSQVQSDLQRSSAAHPLLGPVPGQTGAAATHIGVFTTQLQAALANVQLDPEPQPGSQIGVAALQVGTGTGSPPHPAVAIATATHSRLSN